ncbi:hypothetical protein IPA_09150 [Ignicoccus pacificus DSM 13166]|uniref:HEPN domain-containing protein n=1 Tax=Ignicoccus pacificus DSM 13166 TaxID=940294 RepID=A0A977PKH7_9CREN|nr:hypothetical protein IPA_09150 [Ignicoccus pacificus DSM 13166]
MNNPWMKAAEEYVWGADILMTMGRYAQALLLAAHSYDLCTKARRGDFSKEPLKYAPEEWIQLLFPEGDQTPEDLVTEDKALEALERAKRCLGL